MVQDFKKLMETINRSRRASTLLVQLDGPSLRFSFEDDFGKVVTVNLFDEGTRTSPTITRTESL